MSSHQVPRQDVYSRVTATIVASLDAGVRPWQKPWNATHAAGHITRPLRANGQPYRGINVLLLWGEAMEKGCSAPISLDRVVRALLDCRRWVPSTNCHRR
ncbi:MAG TPA: ArdC-like ssDNA-binding domain-containing protein [Rubrivivax sp.]|nr:ArdC-like ssDNA-binding domain-containing protein [Rubrivivax sp.]